MSSREIRVPSCVPCAVMGVSNRNPYPSSTRIVVLPVFSLASIEGDFAIYDDAHVAPGIQKLHHLAPLASQLRPAGFGVGILLQAAQRLPVEFKVNLAQTLLWRRAHAELRSAQLDYRFVFQQGFTPHGDHSVL